MAHEVEVPASEAAATKATGKKMLDYYRLDESAEQVHELVLVVVLTHLIKKERRFFDLRKSLISRPPDRAKLMFLPLEPHTLARARVDNE